MVAQLSVTIGLSIGIGVVIIVVILLLAGMRGRHEPVKCPECEQVFPRPAFTSRRFRYGISIYGGNLTCPKCAHTGRATFFEMDKEEVRNYETNQVDNSAT